MGLESELNCLLQTELPSKIIYHSVSAAPIERKATEAGVGGAKSSTPNALEDVEVEKIQQKLQMGTPRLVNPSLTDPAMRAFFAKTHVRIVFVDWGLGGLSIMSDFISQLRKTPLLPNMTLIFVDASGPSPWPFISQLQPDLLFIAYNKLSVIYAQEQPSVPCPVITMLHLATEFFAPSMKMYLGSDALVIFGTPTTAKSDLYPKLLAEQGIPREQVVMQDCGESLADDIEWYGARSVEVEHRVSLCVKAAWQQVLSRGLENVSHIFDGMGCTHFGWAGLLFQEAMHAEISHARGTIGTRLKASVLNPNIAMAQYLFTNDVATPSQASDINIQVISGPLSDSQLANIGALVVKPVRDALLNYTTVDPNSL